MKQYKGYEVTTVSLKTGKRQLTGQKVGTKAGARKYIKMDTKKRPGSNPRIRRVITNYKIK